MSRRCARAVPALLLALALVPARTVAQLYTSDTVSYRLSGRLLLSYGGTFAQEDRLLQSHVLTEGASLDLSGYLWDSRYLRFRTFLLGTRTDSFGSGRSDSDVYGYGAYLAVAPRSVLPLTLGYSQNVSLIGSTAQRASTSRDTAIVGDLQLNSPDLPHAEVRGQRVIATDLTGGRSVSDSVLGALSVNTPLHRYTAMVNWAGDRFGNEPRVSRTLVSLSDQITPSDATHADLQATLSQGEGFGGSADAGFTGYQASATLFSRFGERTLFRGGYAHSTLQGEERTQSSNQVSAGATIDLRPIPVLLGEGVSAGTVAIDAPDLHRTLSAVSASQGVATTFRRGALSGSLSGTGQVGYTTVSDGEAGALFGYGVGTALQLDVPGNPLSASAQYQAQEDRSTASLSSRIFSATASSSVSRFPPWSLLPMVLFSHFERTDRTVPGGVTDASTATATVIGTRPIYRTAASFAAGYAENWSTSSRVRSGLLFAHAADNFRLGPGTFGNVAMDLNRASDGGVNTSFLAALSWSFRESSLSFSYTLNRTWPGPGAAHAVALLFSRGFSSSFWPE